MSRAPERGLTWHTTAAAVDLGSNSFHMLVVRGDPKRQRVVGRVREPVGLAAGLGADRRIDTATAARAYACMARFGRLLRAVPDARVRAVATHALRYAHDGPDFVRRGADLLGHPIEVISGAEEARLIYQGVVWALADDAPRRLVVDIGGGSTELIIGARRAPRALESLPLGVVGLTRRFFPDGAIDRPRWQAAIADACQSLAPIAAGYRDIGWHIAVGASGSIDSIARAIAGAGPAGPITAPALRDLADGLVAAGHADRFGRAPADASRRASFAGALAVLTAVFESLELATMTLSTKSLRDGLIAGLFEGRGAARDPAAALARSTA